MAFHGPTVLRADEDEQRQLTERYGTGAAAAAAAEPLKRAASEAGLSVADLGKQRRTASGRSYTLHARTEIPFVNEYVNLTGERVALVSREHPDDATVLVEPAERPLVAVYSERAIVATAPGRIDRDAAVDDDDDDQVRNRWQASVTVNVYEPREIVAFERPLPRIDRFTCAGVIVARDIAEALERATVEQRLHRLVRRIDTHRDDDENEEEYSESELPRVRVYSFDDTDRCLLQYAAQF